MSTPLYFIIGYRNSVFDKIQACYCDPATARATCDALNQSTSDNYRYLVDECPCMDEPSKKLNEHPIYILHGSTGCSCCREDNFCEGPYDTIGEAISSKEYHLKKKTIASQYSEAGEYSIYKGTKRIISDTEYIIGNRVFSADSDDVLLFGNFHIYGEDNTKFLSWCKLLSDEDVTKILDEETTPPKTGA